jgi:hypothetical protein
VLNIINTIIITIDGGNIETAWGYESEGARAVQVCNDCYVILLTLMTTGAQLAQC